ncbi:alpha/beta fold hydrolase [Nocardioides sp.]|uniref:alpha/beta fold hydrolase n=1 Tax=Nocardioides sp. TaxID=35761 RepID=UPI003564AC9E
MDATTRHHVALSGRAEGQPIVFAHGYGCDQSMWRLVTPAFEEEHRVVLFDLAGAGSADPAAYDPERHSSLEGYAQDVVDLLEELDLQDVIFVGHSVSATIGILAERRVPERFGALVLVGPSPRYIDDPPYVGGFSEQDIHELLGSLSSNYLGWSSVMAPVIMGNEDRPEYGQELTASFCRTDPDIARRFARATFLSDNRADLPLVSTPTLVLQCSSDVIAPVEVGEYVHQQIPGSAYALLEATGHCPHLSAPGETIAAITSFLRDRVRV